MRRWPRISLEEVAAFTNGGAWKQSEYVETGIPVVRVSDIRDGTIDLDACKYLPVKSLDKYEKHILYKGDLVVSTVGSHPTQPASMVGKPAIVPSSAHGALLNQNAVRISPTSDRLDKQYLGYLGQSQVFRDYIAQCARGAASQVRMSIELFKKMEIPLPPLPTQRKIAAILSAYDDLIENNTRRIAILEDMAQAIYREWFVHFRFPGHEGVRMVESELGPVPEGWEVTKVRDIARRLKAETTYRASDVSEVGQVPVIDQSRDDILGFHNNKPDHLASPEKPVIIFGDHTCKMQLIVRPFSLGPNVVPFISKGNIPISYLFFLVQNLVETREYKRHWTELTNKKVVVATDDCTRSFVEIVTPILEEIELLSQKSLNLRRTRNLLLPRLISGELDVSELDIDTGAPDT